LENKNAATQYSDELKPIHKMKKALVIQQAQFTIL